MKQPECENIDCGQFDTSSNSYLECPTCREMHRTQWEAREKEIKRLRELVKAAICPSCDGSGGYYTGSPETGGEAVQCQWCHVRKTILAESEGGDG